MAPLLRQARRALALCSITLAGCGALPEDHAANDLVGRSSAGIRRSVSKVPALLLEQERGLLHIGDRLAALPAQARDRSVQFARALTNAVQAQRDAVAKLLPNMSSDLGRSAGRELRGARGIAASAEGITSRFGRDLTTVRRDAFELPTYLHVSRDFMPMPTDRERTVDLDPPARRRTLLERVLDRMSL